MIIIDSGVSEVVVQQLYSLCSNQLNPYFTWEIKRKSTGEVIVFTQDDHSPVSYYYNSFTFSVGTNIGLTAGTINARPGEYNYRIYESTIPYNLATQSLNLLQEGILIINATFSQTYTGTSSTNIYTYNSY